MNRSWGIAQDKQVKNETKPKQFGNPSIYPSIFSAETPTLPSVTSSSSSDGISRYSKDSWECPRTSLGTPWKKASPRKSPGGSWNRCLNHVNWLLSMCLSSGSAPSSSHNFQGCLSPGACISDLFSRSLTQPCHHRWGWVNESISRSRASPFG